MASTPLTRRLTLSPQLNAWLQLLRVPNLLTVPGDPLAGFFITGGFFSFFKGVSIIMASLGFYAAGLLINDLVDLETDRMERPDRPLPSGKVGRRTVLTTALLLLIFAVTICICLGKTEGCVGGFLALVIVIYNCLFKKNRLAGSIAMGACRGLNLLLGASAASPHIIFPFPVLLAAGILACYIGAVTFLAHGEMQEHPIGIQRWIPSSVLTIGMILFFFQMPPPSHLEKWVFGLSNVIAGGSAVAASITLFAKGIPSSRYSQAIGLFISLLLLFQAGLIAISGTGRIGLWTSLALLGLWPINRFMGKWFYSS